MISWNGLNDFNWERVFSNTNVNEKIRISNKSVLNLFSNFILHETLLCNDIPLSHPPIPPSPHPSWFKSQIKSFSLIKNKVFKHYRRNKTNIQLLNKLNFLQDRLNTITNQKIVITNVCQTSYVTFKEIRNHIGS